MMTVGEKDNILSGEWSVNRKSTLRILDPYVWLLVKI